MKWDELTEKQGNDYKNYLTGYKQSLEQLNADKALLLGSHTEANAPDAIKDKISRDQEGWKQEWGMYGQKFKAMRISHQKEVDSYFRREGIVKDLKTNEKSKTKEKDGGR